jgi:hypothetical protein
VGAAHLGDEHVFQSARRYEIDIENSVKHTETKRRSGGRDIGAEPTSGQLILDDSVPLSGNTKRRIGYDVENDEFVVFHRTGDWLDRFDDGADFVRGGLYHGHVRSWKELTGPMKRALRDSKLFNQKGKYIGPRGQ